MPPSMSMRAHFQSARRPDSDDSDSDEVPEATGAGWRAQLFARDPDEGMEDDLIGDEELEDGDALVSPHQDNTPLPNLDPPPSYFREISTLASWTVSSSKPGCSIPQLRHPSTSLFWQSDGPQPHYLNIHFFKLVRIVGLRLYLDFEQDESYTPTRIIFLAGSGMNDLQEWGEMRLESPRGWIWADFSGVGDPDSDSEDDDEDDDEDQSRQAAGLSTDASAPPAHDASSDSENNVPRPRQPLVEDPMQLDPDAHTPAPHAQTHTPQPLLHPDATPTLTRPTPRLPFAALSPNPTRAHPSSSSPRRPKIPVLRAHLVQIKILENHQNGKDTHLRGLQIFARNDEEGVMEAGSRNGVRMLMGEDVGRGMVKEKGGKGKKREERWELGGGMRWEAEGGIR
ncbi:galactose-binding like protein [Pyrenochaeta sp. DS3sAY3a]|nr:galactose-binding like protein [Pyrenochaeta sp. DS3sAY3a]